METEAAPAGMLLYQCANGQVSSAQHNWSWQWLTKFRRPTVLWECSVSHWYRQGSLDHGDRGQDAQGLGVPQPLLR